MVSRTQYRIMWRGRDWPASKPTASRLFRHPTLAEAFTRELRAEGASIIAVEEREMSTSPWRPCEIGGQP